MVYEFHSCTELQVAEKLPKLVSPVSLRRTSPPRQCCRACCGIRVPLLWDGFSAQSIFRHKPVSPKSAENSWMLELKIIFCCYNRFTFFPGKNKRKIQSPCVCVYIHTHICIHIYIDIHIMGTNTSDDLSELNKRYQMYFVIFLEVSYKAQTMQIISPNDCS